MRQVREGEAIAVLIVAHGEDALRLRKRLTCAARALDIELAINEQRGEGGIPHVLVDGVLVFEGLPRTEVIEERLAACLAERDST